MGVGDSDLIDKALDAAEAKVVDASAGDAVQETGNVSGSPESGASDRVEEAAAAEAHQKFSQTRDKSGKYLKGKSPAAKSKQVSDRTIESDTGAEALESGEAQPPDESAEAGALPAFWSAELKAAAAQAPRALVQKFMEHDARRELWARRMVAESEPAKQHMQRIKETFEPHRAKFAVHGVRDELDAVGRLMAWNEIFETDPWTGINDLMRKNGFTAQDFFDDGSGYTQQGGDPRFEEALTAAREAQETAQALKSQLEAQQMEQGRAFIEQFKSEPDSSGQPRAAFFETYRPQIVQAFQEIQKQAPEMPEHEALGHAYEFVLGEARKLHGMNKPPATMLTKPSAPTANRAMKAAKSVSGAPNAESATAKPKLKGKNFNEKFDAAFNNVAERIGL